MASKNQSLVFLTIMLRYWEKISANGTIKNKISGDIDFISLKSRSCCFNAIEDSFVGTISWESINCHERRQDNLIMDAEALAYIWRRGLMVKLNTAIPESCAICSTQTLGWVLQANGQCWNSDTIFDGDWMEVCRVRTLCTFCDNSSNSHCGVPVHALLHYRIFKVNFKASQNQPLHGCVLTDPWEHTS